MLTFFKSLLLKPVKRLAIKIFNRLEQWSQADLPRFATRPKNLTIARPRRISSPERISIGDDVYLGPGSLLTVSTRYPGSAILPRGMSVDFQQTFDASIVIGNRVTSTGGLTVGAFVSITIEDDVLLAGNVMISDALHGYETAETPYKYQPMGRIAPILVKRGCWIGQNVVVMPGVTIGEFSIVGANSVVTADIPARSIAVGAPARVIRRWNDADKRWGSVVA